MPISERVVVDARVYAVDIPAAAKAASAASGEMRAAKRLHSLSSGRESALVTHDKLESETASSSHCARSVVAAASASASGGRDVAGSGASVTADNSSSLAMAMEQRDLHLYPDLLSMEQLLVMGCACSPDDPEFESACCGSPEQPVDLSALDGMALDFPLNVSVSVTANEVHHHDDHNDDHERNNNEAWKKKERDYFAGESKALALFVYQRKHSRAALICSARFALPLTVHSRGGHVRLEQESRAEMQGQTVKFGVCIQISSLVLFYHKIIFKIQNYL
jgi:hypothetical protein